VPQVEFHSGIGDALHYTCRLLRKAWRQRVAVVVTAPAPALQVLDRELWTFEAQEFVPHRRVAAGTEQADAALRRTPIWLCDAAVPAGAPAVLVNWDGDMPSEPARFERIVEIVSEGADERQRARARWRDYAARGWDVRHHERGAVG
jgi:DNA polymerase-3 subunit chi